MRKCAIFLAALLLAVCAGAAQTAPADSIVLLLHEIKLGHIAMLISGPDGKYHFYSINGNNIYLSARFVSGGWYAGNRRYNDVGERSWDTPLDFLRSSFNSNGRTSDASVTACHYTVGYAIPTTAEQNATMAATFTRLATSAYNLLNNNCATACIKSMASAGLPVAPPEGTDPPDPPGMPQPDGFQRVFIFLSNITGAYDFPYLTFRRLVSANPGGTFIR